MSLHWHRSSPAGEDSNTHHLATCSCQRRMAVFFSTDVQMHFCGCIAKARQVAVYLVVAALPTADDFVSVIAWLEWKSPLLLTAM